MTFISCIMSAIMLFVGGNMYDSIQDAFKDAEAIIIYKDNEREYITCDTDRFNEIITNFNTMLTSSKQMPAFGVSIDAHTKEELKKGIWIEFIYSNTKEEFNMPFDSLLINVQDNYQGFNVIRGNDGKYNGRCYYIDLEGSMHEFYEFIK